MKRYLGLLLVGMLIGSVFSFSMFASPVRATEVSSGNDAYTAFWDILMNESQLVVALNQSPGNKTLAINLVSTSRLGEKNAVNISASIWKALETLKQSGVKMYYSPEELREMAQNISKNGLPKETVQSLKSQGWTDEEINELEEYIAKNANNITSGFNMTAFLQNFSLAFVRVGFKYSYYESWAFHKGFWETHEQNVTPPSSYKKKVNPVLSSEWVDFYTAYSKGDIKKALASISALSNRMETLFKFQETLNNLRILLLVKNNNNFNVNTLNNVKVTGVTHAQNGSLLIHATYYKYTKLGYYQYTDSYYWWNAIDAYRTAREIYVLLSVMENGNNDQQLREMLNQKVAQLKDELIVDCVETSNPVHLKPAPNPTPIPIPKPPEPIGVRSIPTTNLGISSTSSSEKTRTATSAEVLALSPDSNYGYIKIVAVDVVPVDITTTYATYKVVVHFQAINNVVTNVKVTFHGTGLSSEVNVGGMHPDDGVKTVSSVVSSKISGDGASSVVAAGTVTITGESSLGPIPTSEHNDPVLEESGVKNVSVSESYHKVINLNSPIDPSKVTFVVFTDPTSPVLVGSNVNFKIYVYNGNNKPITFNYRLDIQCPTSQGQSSTKTVTGSISLANNSGKTITAISMSFDRTGSFGYSGTLYFGQYSKTSQGILDVRATSIKGSNITILGVSISPSPAKAGKPVTFTVKLKNNYSTKKSADVTVYLGDSLKQSKTVSIAAHNTTSLTLQLVPHNPGNYTWSVQVHTSNNGNSILEDSRMGELNVLSSSQEFAVKLEAFPEELKGGGTVFFTIKAWNFAYDGLNIQFHVVNESGKVVYPKNGGWVSKFVPKGAGNYSLNAFSLSVHGIGMHKYTVIARISGEEEKSTATVEVEPTNGTKLEQVGFECNDLYLSTGLDREHHLLYRGTLTCEAILYNPTSRNLIGNITDVYAIKISPRTLDENLVGEWGYTARINIKPHSYYTIVFQRNSTSINVYTLEHDLYGLTFTVELHYEFKGMFNKEFVGIASAEITQNSVQAAISGTIFIGGTVATAVGFFMSVPALSIVGGISFIVGLYQTAG